MAIPNGIMIPIVMISAGATIQYGNTLVLNGTTFNSPALEATAVPPALSCFIWIPPVSGTVKKKSRRVR